MPYGCLGHKASGQAARRVFGPEGDRDIEAAMNEEMPVPRICSTCDEAVTEFSFTGETKFEIIRTIEQRSTAGLSLEPVNFAVIAYAAWIDIGMDHTYSRNRVYYPAVGLS
jgi:hypothetical protein